MDGEQHVVAHLGDLAGAERPGVKQVLPHAGKHGFGRLKIRLFATDDEGEGARRRAGHAPRDGGIEKTDAARLRRRPHLTGRSHIDGGAVDDQGAERQGRQQILPAPLTGTLAQPEAAHMLARRQHADHQLAAAHRLAGIAGSDAAGLDGAGQALGHQIKHLHCVPRPGQVGGHGAPHVAKPDKSNPCHGLFLVCDRPSAGAQGVVPLGPAIEVIQPGLARLRALPAG